MTVWADMEDDVSAVVDATFGELWEFRPMARLTVNDPVSIDQTRTVREVTGIYGAPASEVNLLSSKPARSKVLGGDGQGVASLMMPRVSFDDSQFASDEIPIAGDRLMRKTTGDVYSVSDAQPDGQGRAIYSCSHVYKEAVA